MLAPVVAFIRHSYVRKHITVNINEDEDKDKFDAARAMNKRAFYLSIVGGVGGLGVASFQSSIDECGGTNVIVGIHCLFALMFFTGGLFYCVYSHWLDNILPNLGTERERFQRKCFYYGSLFQFIIMWVIPWFYNYMGSFTLVVMSFFEVTLLLTFMSTYVTFLEEMKATSFRLVVMTDDRTYSLNERMKLQKSEDGRKPTGEIKNVV